MLKAIRALVKFGYDYVAQFDYCTKSCSWSTARASSPKL